MLKPGSAKTSGRGWTGKQQVGVPPWKLGRGNCVPSLPESINLRVTDWRAQIHKNIPLFRGCILPDWLSPLCLTCGGVVICNCSVSPCKEQSFWSLQLHKPYLTSSLYKCIWWHEKSDIPAEQLGPNKLSSAQVSQDVPPNPSCRTPHIDDVRPKGICGTQGALGFLTDGLASVCFSNISFLCACPEAPFYFFLYSLLFLCFNVFINPCVFFH